MRAIIPVLLLLAPALPAAEDPAAASAKKLSAVSLLPDGSQLHGVMFPRYDENQHLIGLLKAKTMTLVNSETISGDEVTLEFFNSDHSPRGRADLQTAVFHQSKGMLETREPITLRSDSISANGAGLFYSLNNGEGFLIGPATTWIEAAPKTAMNTNHSPLRATAALGMSLLTLPLSAAAPPPLTPAEDAAILADAESSAATHAAATRAAIPNLRADLEASAAATAAATAFLEESDLLAPASPAAPPAVPPAAPLDIKPGPDDTVVSCKGGMYFDTDKGVFVYLKDVTVTDPRFSLTGANELKIFLGKKPEKTPAKTADDPAKADKNAAPDLGLGAKFGDVEQILATGAVRILQKSVEAGKEPVEASGAIFTYHPKSGEIVLRGGYPWVRQGPNYMRAKEPNLILRIQKDGSFITQGDWEMGGKIPKKP